jgi:hypothetical protein
MHMIPIRPAADNMPTPGPLDARLRHALQLRLHELQHRLPSSLTPNERRELVDLKELLMAKEEGPR